jgi:hypothetical protein
MYLYYSNNDDTSRTNYEALGDDIDFESDANTCCLKTTFDDATGITDDATGNTNDMMRMNENTFIFLSPVAEKLYQDISNNSPSKLKMHSRNTMENMVDNIQYIIKNRNIENTQEVGRLWDQLETFIQETKMKVQKETYVTPKKGLSFPVFHSKKSKPIGRCKGISG